MTGKIVMNFVEVDDEGFSMECEVDIHDFTKADLINVITTLCKRLGLTERDWKNYRIAKMLDELLSEYDGYKRETE